MPAEEAKPEVYVRPAAGAAALPGAGVAACPSDKDDRTTIDAFLGGAIEVQQPARGYRAGLDAVLLAACVEAPGVGGAAGFDVLDVGAGVGVVGLSLARRLPEARVVLLERQPELCELARANVERNDFRERVAVIEADLTARGAHRERLGGRTFAHTLANPPYHAEGFGTPAPSASKRAAHAMPAGDLERWVRFLASATAAGGETTIVYRADGLAELLAALEGRFGGASVLPVHPRADVPAVRVLVRGRKGSRAPLSIAPGLVLHDEAGRVRPEVDAILRHGAPLPMRAAAARRGKSGVPERHRGSGTPPRATRR
jgi:tRNA1(Val) A37 N6-methylase TrmN6